MNLPNDRSPFIPKPCEGQSELWPDHCQAPLSEADSSPHSGLVPGLVRGGARARFGGGAGARFGGGAGAHFWCRVPGPGTTLGQLFLRNSNMLVCVVPGARGRL